MTEQRRSSSTDEKTTICRTLAELLAEQMNGQLESVALNDE